ncbi:Rpn family recombination-promoting nuclease/putative transposase [Butyrivibrio sp. VCD2006]|uniref:Rpn family recombination-promoting nuclease/putative transposase n=1 Tax=Butyrivibrio sp. VCD2006 TaxID=1280664 RepID=UPI0004241623|nr:Rpn family recombination-promoting nuclease/putative transposase [Butyrivibrio sp. VCD2006]
MFCKILEENEDLCKEMTELILGRKIGSIVKDPVTEKAIKLTPDGHGIRFDVYFLDDNNQVFDIEMQTGKKGELPRRSRYYQGMLDLNYLKEGKKYKDLPNSYIIFICTFDAFDAGYHKYSFRPACNEDNQIVMEDGTNRIFICAGGHRNDVSEDLEAFIDYIAGKISDNRLVQNLDRKVHEAREDKRWRAEYMTLQDMLDDELEQGMDIGDLRRLIKQVNDNVSKGRSVDLIADFLGETVETIQEIIEVIKSHEPDYDEKKIAEEILARRKMKAEKIE